MGIRLSVFFSAVPILILQTSLGWAQNDHAHDTMMVGSTEQHNVQMGVATEPGQGAFATIAEIVVILRNDLSTNWQFVDIDGLRTHLVDMDKLVTDTVVSEVQIENGIEMTISTDGRVGDAVRRMVPAHGPVLASETGWISEVEEFESAMVWRVTSPTDTEIINALGFFGLMALGNHHTAHHLALAQGKMVH